MSFPFSHFFGVKNDVVISIMFDTIIVVVAFFYTMSLKVLLDRDI